jgi:signal transduction histidine kinase
MLPTLPKKISCLAPRLRYNRLPELKNLNQPPQNLIRRPAVAQADCEDALADFAHRLRQPLSALEAVASYLDLIVPEDARVREQLRRIHLQIEQADEILRDGMRDLRVYLPAAGGSGLAPNSLAAPAEEEELSRPLTMAAMASVTY